MAVRRVMGFAAAFVAAALAGGAGSQARDGVSGVDALLVSSTRSALLHDEIWVVDVETGSRRNLSRSPTSDRNGVASPDGRLVAFVSDRSGRESLWVRRTDGGGLRRLVAAPTADAYVGGPVWSPDGGIVAVPVGGAIQLVPIRSGRPLELPGNAFPAPAWSPDGRRLALTSGRERHAEVYDRRGRRLWRRSGETVGWSARGLLAIGEEAGAAIVSAGGRVLVRLPRVSVLQWSPNGGSLASADRQGRLRIFTADGRLLLVKRGLDLWSGVVWAPDGRSLLTYDTDGRLVRVSVDGRVTRLGQDEWALSYNAAGDLLVLQGRRVVVHRRDGATRRLALPNLSGSFCGGGFYGSWIDRRRILVEGGLHGQRTGDIWRVDPATGRETMFAGGPDWEAAPALSPNGASVAFEVGGAITHGGGCSGPYTPLIAVVRPDGSGRRAVTSTGRTHDFAPRWSPAGDALAVRRESLGEENDFGVVVVNPKTRAERWLVRGRAATPSWSSEGNSVVFEGAQGVVRAPRGGGAVVAIAAGGKTPAASPTAAVVAFVRDGALWTVGLDGSGQRRLASVATAPEEPRWSPDGRRLAIAGTDAIVVVGADGTGLRTIDRAGAFQLAWSPDSQRLAFAAPVGRYTRELFNNDLANRSDVFVVSADGGVPRRVTHDFANVDGIAWGRLAPQ